jgi:hypothetical protein
MSKVARSTVSRRNAHLQLVAAQAALAEERRVHAPKPLDMSGALHALLEIDALIQGAQASLRGDAYGGAADLTLDVARRLLEETHDKFEKERARAKARLP